MFLTGKWAMQLEPRVCVEISLNIILFDLQFGTIKLTYLLRGFLTSSNFYTLCIPFINLFDFIFFC